MNVHSEKFISRAMRLHLRGREPRGLRKHRELVALEGAIGEDVEVKVAHGQRPAGTRDSGLGIRD